MLAVQRLKDLNGLSIVAARALLEKAGFTRTTVTGRAGNECWECSDGSKVWFERKHRGEKKFRVIRMRRVGSRKHGYDQRFDKFGKLRPATFDPDLKRYVPWHPKANSNEEEFVFER